MSAAPSDEALPEGWRWDRPEGPWACHAYRIDAATPAVTLHADGRLMTIGLVPTAVLQAVHARARRLGFVVPDRSGQPK